MLIFRQDRVLYINIYQYIIDLKKKLIKDKRMKKLLCASCILYAFLCASFADTASFTGGSTKETRQYISGTTNNTDVLLVGNDSGTYYFNGNFATLKSITGNDTGTYSVAFDFTVDANSADVVSVWSLAGSFAYNYGMLTFKNTASSSALASFSTDGTFTVDSPAEQTQSLVFDSITANFSTGNGLFVGGTDIATSSLVVKSSANVEIAGSQTYGASGTLDVQGTLVSTGKQTFESGSKLSVSGSLTSSGAMVFTVGAALDLKSGGTLTLSGGEISRFSGVNSSGKLVQTTTSDVGLNIVGPSYVNEGSDWSIDGKIYVSGTTSDLNSDLRAKLYVNGGNITIKTSSGGNRVILQNGSLYINDGSVFKSTNGIGDHICIVTVNSTSNVDAVYLNSSTVIDRFYIASLLNLYLDDESTLTLTSESHTHPIEFNENGSLSIYNFREDSIFITNNIDSAKIDIDGKVSLYDENGLFLGMAGVSDTGALTLVVPEPAEVALMFGALSLFAVAFRRRI